jgi:hypothetical protein
MSTNRKRQLKPTEKIARWSFGIGAVFGIGAWVLFALGGAFGAGAIAFIVVTLLIGGAIYPNVIEIRAKERLVDRDVVTRDDEQKSNGNDQTT